MTEIASEDMNATPLAKLPPPVLQSKASQPPLELPNYRDLLHDVDHTGGNSAGQQHHSQHQPPPQQQPPLNHRPMVHQTQNHQQPLQQAHLQSQQPQQHQQQHQQYQQSPHMPQEYMNQDMYATQNAYMPQQYGNPMYPPHVTPPPVYYSPTTHHPSPYSSEDGTAPDPPGGNALLRFIKSNKATFLVVLLVFVTMFFVGPRLAKYPKFAATDAFGSTKLSALGMAAAAVLAGGVFRLSLLAM